MNLQDEGGDTALLEACIYGRNEAVTLLLKHDEVDMNLQNNDGDTALLVASSNGHEDIVVNLLKHGNVDLNLQNNEGSTALIAASINGHTDIVFQLLKHDPCEALVWVFAMGHTEMARRLEDNAQNSSRREDDEKSPFDTDEQPPRKKQHR